MLSNVCVNIAAAKKATARRISVPTLTRFVTQRRREHKDAARAYGMLAAILEQQLTGAGDNVLRFLGGVRMPAEMSAGFDFVNDGGRLRRAVPAVESERGTLRYLSSVPSSSCGRIPGRRWSRWSSSS
jgi:hypothetical protein